MSRNYITRMIIRRAARFASKLDLNEPFMAGVADVVIDLYGKAYPELIKNREIILSQLTREEERFQKTVEGGIAQLESIIIETKTTGLSIIPGKLAFELYATHGLPLEISRDIALEYDLKVDEQGFKDAMEVHRLASGGGKAMGGLGGEDAEIFQNVFKTLQEQNKLEAEGVRYDPYTSLQVEGEVLSIVNAGERSETAAKDDEIEIVLPETGFYVAAGGQVSDTGKITSMDKNWEVLVTDTRRPAAGLIAHRGKVLKGSPTVGDLATAQIDLQRRQDIMRNHTATHLLHAELDRVLGTHARQAGSLVAPDRLRFDFTHPEALTKTQLDEIEEGVNRHILSNYPLNIEYKSLDQAKSEGARALFGEKYGDVVRTIQIGGDQPFSYELCGGTHVESTGEIGTFLIVSEGSVASGIRRIEAVTGRRAYQTVQQRIAEIEKLSDLFKTHPDQVIEKAESLLTNLMNVQKENSALRRELAGDSFSNQMENAPEIQGVRVLTGILPEADRNTMREMTDLVRQKFESGVAVLATVIDNKPALIAAITEDLVAKGLRAGDLVQVVAEVVGGTGGGRPNMAQAGGKDAAKLDQALAKVVPWVEEKLTSKS
jgi:alanyl-tRNA synthetase